MPTARVHHLAEGVDLVLPRTFRASIEDVWAAITEPERTARWFGPWEGEGAPGRTIQVRMLFEEGEPWYPLRIDACEPPRRLAVSSTDESGGWRMELRLVSHGETTELQLVHHLDSIDPIPDAGPGWEYYLDLLMAAFEGTPQPDFADYHPALVPYFQELAGKPAS
ncbi:SRPBCC family protein [Amycolatopsis jejuensis]|uniref:SRPBCC family protein n=1 Tax=Amycolatopsis jejuensis TaxID=330084 RepID=UPI000524604A|nr:SRPBCC family protein [Amycolatopsis jejuensis]